MTVDFTLAPRPSADLRWLAVDLDKTLAEASHWPVLHPVWPIGPPIPSAVAKVRDAVAHGWKVIIHTARPWADYEMIEGWLTANDIPFNRIVCGKLLAAAYIDDRNIDPQAGRWYPEG